MTAFQEIARRSFGVNNLLRNNEDWATNWVFSPNEGADTEQGELPSCGTVRA